MQRDLLQDRPDPNCMQSISKIEKPLQLWSSQNLRPQLRNPSEQPFWEQRSSKTLSKKIDKKKETEKNVAHLEKASRKRYVAKHIQVSQPRFAGSTTLMSVARKDQDWCARDLRRENGIETAYPSTPPPPPRPTRLPSPDLSDLEDNDFCSCCGESECIREADHSTSRRMAYESVRAGPDIICRKMEKTADDTSSE